MQKNSRILVGLADKNIFKVLLAIDSNNSLMEDKSCLCKYSSLSGII